MPATITQLQADKAVQLKKKMGTLLSGLVTFVHNNKIIQNSVILYFSGHIKLVNHIINGIDA